MRPPDARALRILRRVLYWLAVLVVSLVILVALIRFFESRDTSQVGHGSSGAVVAQRLDRGSLALSTAARAGAGSALSRRPAAA